jgi:hypothetical protein
MDRGFESRLRHGCLSLSTLCCPVQVQTLREMITRPRDPMESRKMIRKPNNGGMGPHRAVEPMINECTSESAARLIKCPGVSINCPHL